MIGSDEIVLDDGKYRFHMDEGVLQCERYGEKWRDFIGDKAVSSLFDKCFEVMKLDEKFPRVSILEEEYYLIQCQENEPFYMQRRKVFKASDDPLSPQETIIIALCDKIGER